MSCENIQKLFIENKVSNEKTKLLTERKKERKKERDANRYEARSKRGRRKIRNAKSHSCGFWS